MGAAGPSRPGFTSPPARRRTHQVGRTRCHRPTPCWSRGSNLDLTLPVGSMPESTGMLKGISRRLDSGRVFTAGSVIAVAAVGLGVTFLAVGALGSEGSRVEPIVVDTSDRLEEGGGVELARDETRLGNDAELDTQSPWPRAGGGSSRSQDPGRSDVDRGQLSGTSSGNATSGPVPTAPPPAPRAVAPVDDDHHPGAVGVDDDDDNRDDDDDEVSDDPHEPDTPDGEDEDEDD